MFRTKGGLSKWVFYKTLHGINCTEISLLHAMIESNRINGEFFSLLTEEIDQLKNRIANAIDKVINTPKTGNEVESIHLSPFDYDLFIKEHKDLGITIYTFNHKPIFLNNFGQSYLKTGFGDVYV